MTLWFQITNQNLTTLLSFWILQIPLSPKRKLHIVTTSQPIHKENMKQFSIVIFFLFTFSSCNGDTVTRVIYSECSDRKISSSSPYQYNLNSLLTSLTNSATFTTYANFTASIASPLYPVSGIYQCRADLSFSDCESCVKQAVSQLPSLCSSSESATVQLQGCLLQYGNNSFIGKSDETLRFKRYLKTTID